MGFAGALENAAAHGDGQEQRLGLVLSQMRMPGEGHEDVGDQQKTDRFCGRHGGGPPAVSLLAASQVNYS